MFPLEGYAADWLDIHEGDMECLQVELLKGL